MFEKKKIIERNRIKIFLKIQKCFFFVENVLKMSFKVVKSFKSLSRQNFTEFRCQSYISIELKRLRLQRPGNIHSGVRSTSGASLGEAVRMKITTILTSRNLELIVIFPTHFYNLKLLPLSCSYQPRLEGIYLEWLPSLALGELSEIKPVNCQ